MDNFDDEKLLSFISSYKMLDINLLTFASLRGDVVLLSQVYDFVHSSNFELEKFPGMTDDFWSYKRNNSMSPMMGAVKSDNYKVVEFLCLMGRSKDIFTFDSHGVTPFLVCCMRCNRNIFCYILYQDVFTINVNDLRVQFPTDLTRTVWKAQYFLDNTQNCSGYTPLHIIVQLGELSLLESLCDFGAGADIYVLAHDLFSPLMTACLFGHFEIVKYLLLQNRELQLMDVSTFVNMIDKYGRNAAFEACCYGSFEIFEFLYQSSCNLKIIDIFNQSLFECAIRKCHNSEESKLNDHFAIFKFMLEHGALDDVPVALLHSASPHHQHPLSVAVALDLSSVVDVLLSHLSESLIREMFPLYLERFPGSFKVIKLLSFHFFQLTDDKSWLFTILSAHLQVMVYEKQPRFLDLLCFDMFGIHPRLLFQNYFLEINFGDSISHSSFKIEAALGIRLIELGCLHDTDNIIRTEQAMFLFKRLRPDSAAFLIYDRVFFLLIVKKMFKIRLSRLSDDFSCLILHFAGIVDFISVNHLKDFISFYHVYFFRSRKDSKKAFLTYQEQLK